MPEEHAVTTAHLNFIAELNHLRRRRAGDPTLPRLRQLSEQLYQSGKVRVVLTRSTTSDVLACKRATLPSWAWVASFLATCRAAAAETGLDPDSLGSTSEWNLKWQSAQAAADIETTGPADDDAGEGGLLAAPIGLISSLPHPAGDDRDPPGRDAQHDGPPAHHDQADGRANDSADDLADNLADDLADDAGQTVPPPDPTIRLHRYLEDYGRTGARLLRHAERGDGESAYRLSVLLTCDGRPREADEWLRLAAHAGHDEVSFYARLDRGRAIEAAFELGRQYDAAGHCAAALVFLTRAGQSGHPEAAYMVGLHYAQNRKHWEAATWFSRAALAGHPGAQREYKAMHRQLAFSGLNPPLPDPAYYQPTSPYAPDNPFSLDSPWFSNDTAADFPVADPDNSPLPVDELLDRLSATHPAPGPLHDQPEPPQPR